MAVDVGDAPIWRGFVGLAKLADRPARRGILKDKPRTNTTHGGPWAKGAPSEDHTPYGHPFSPLCLGTRAWLDNCLL